MLRFWDIDMSPQALQKLVVLAETGEEAQGYASMIPESLWLAVKVNLFTILSAKINSNYSPLLMHPAESRDACQETVGLILAHPEEASCPDQYQHFVFEGLAEGPEEYLTAALNDSQGHTCEICNSPLIPVAAYKLAGEV